MRPRSNSASASLVAMVLACAGSAWGGARPCIPGGDASPVLWAAADFDGDNVIDWAGVQLAGESVRFLAPCGTAPSLFLYPAPLGWSLSVRDVDSDHDQDLVLNAPYSSRVYKMWLNDGAGRFSLTDPTAFPSAGGTPPEMRRPAVHPVVPAAAAPFQAFADRASSSLSCVHRNGPGSRCAAAVTSSPAACPHELARGRAPPPSL